MPKPKAKKKKRKVTNGGGTGETTVVPEEGLRESGPSEDDGPQIPSDPEGPEGDSVEEESTDSEADSDHEGTGAGEGAEPDTGRSSERPSGSIELETDSGEEDTSEVQAEPDGDSGDATGEEALGGQVPNPPDGESLEKRVGKIENRLDKFLQWGKKKRLFAPIINMILEGE